MNPGSTSERDYLLNQLNAIEKSLQKQFGETYKSAINLGEIRNVINSGDSFSFDKNPSAKKKVDSMLKTLQGNISTFVGDKIETVGRVATQTAKDGVNKQIKPTKSQQKFTDELINDATKTARQNASESAGEYKLSPQVWNFTDYGKKEIQAMVNAGIRKGLTVQKIADSVLPYLKNPNLEESEPEFQAIKTPKGVYKSAYKNALRMARTEVLRGYDEAEWNSYQNDPMVVGFEIKISNNHTTKQGGKKRPLKDMCDELAGKYPKSFKFTGWHPQCRCTMIPITIGADELGDLMEAEENGETFVSKDAITQLPENFTEWYDANKDRFNTNNEPYFLSDNQNIIENGGVVEVPTAEESLPSSISFEEWKKPLEEAGIQVYNDREVESITTDYIKNFDFAKIMTESKNIMEKYGVYGKTLRMSLTLSRDNALGTDQVNFTITNYDDVTLTRLFRVEDGVVWVEHVLFQIPPSMQGKGMSKEILGLYYDEYKKAGIDKIDVHANIDVGGYTWSRYGFSCYERFGRNARSLVEDKCPETHREQALNIVNEFYSTHSSTTPFPMNLFYEKLGRDTAKEILLGTSWFGSLDLHDKEQTKVFESYLNSKKKKT